MTDQSDNTENTAAFSKAPLSRRQFTRLSGAIAGTLAMPGQSVADVCSGVMTDTYQFVVNHTPKGEPIPTLVTFEGHAGLEEFTILEEIDPITTTTPTMATHANLTREQVKDVIEINGVASVRFSPGSNPFWLLDYYPRGIFPAPHESVGFIDYEQMVDGLTRLEEKHSNRLRFHSVGQSPGHFNFVKNEETPRDVYVAEVTNNIDDEEAFKKKEKVVFSLSIHGDERAGVEAGTRFIEDLLNGEESEVEKLLDDIVLVFIYTNPDGWVARYPQYNDEGTGYQRGTAGVEDPNRSYPTVGWIDATHYPAEPHGADLENDDQGFDVDIASQYTERVPDSLAIVEHLRDYENLTYGSDLHGMGASEHMIEGLLINDQFTPSELHDLYEYNRTTKHRLDERLGPLLNDNKNLFSELNVRYQDEDEKPPTPTEAFDYGTVYDTLEYSTTGILVSWMAQPESQGGLGMQVMAHEMAYSNDETPNQFVGTDDFQADLENLVELFVTGYQTVIRTLAEHATETVTAKLETDGSRTAIVTSDTLHRSSESLVFVDQDALTVSEAEEAQALTGQVIAENGTRKVQTPDPTSVLDYQQREYEVIPFAFFDDLSDIAGSNDKKFDNLMISEVADGALVTDSGERAYDNLLLIHDECTSAYLDAVDQFVEAGGNIVLTDTGVQILGQLETSVAAGITSEDVTNVNYTFAIFEQDNYPHSLLADTRRFNDELWKLSPLGRAIQPEEGEGEAPMTLVDPEAFTTAGGTIAARTNDMVAAGSLRGDGEEDGQITIIGSLLPPASQVHLHPFGMVNYTVSFFGSLVLTNALGYQQKRYVNGDLVQSFGPGEKESAKDKEENNATSDKSL